MMKVHPLDECFHLGICAYKPFCCLFIKVKPQRYIYIDLEDKTVEGTVHGYNLMLHCEYSNEADVPEEVKKLAEQLIEANKDKIEADFFKYEKLGY